MEVEKLLLRPDISGHFSHILSSNLTPLIERHVKEAISKTFIPIYSQQSSVMHQELLRELRTEIHNVKTELTTWQSEAFRSQEVSHPTSRTPCSILTLYYPSPRSENWNTLCGLCPIKSSSSASIQLGRFICYNNNLKLATRRPLLFLRFKQILINPITANKPRHSQLKPLRAMVTIWEISSNSHSHRQSCTEPGIAQALLPLRPLTLPHYRNHHLLNRLQSGRLRSSPNSGMRSTSVSCTPKMRQNFGICYRTRTQSSSCL